MKTLFYKYPTTIGEELEAQISYCKNKGTIQNMDRLSLKMRELEKEIFGKARSYKGKNESESNHSMQSRPAVISDLKKIKINEEVSNYFLLFSAFKALNIIKEDYNIIKLLDSYGIKPKKAIDKERLEDLRESFEDVGLYSFAFHTKCSKEKSKLCRSEAKCIFLKLKKLFDTISEDEQIKMLYQLGFPSNLMKIDPKIYGMYYICLETLKKILKEFEEQELIEYINEEETTFKERHMDFEQSRKSKLQALTKVSIELMEENKEMIANQNDNAEKMQKMLRQKENISRNKRLQETVFAQDKIEKTKTYQEMIYKIKEHSNGLFGKYKR